MKDGFMVLPTDISAEVDLLKAKIVNALDNLESFYKKEVKGKAQENVQKMKKKAEEENKKAEEEKKQQEAEKEAEEKNRSEEEHIEGYDKMIIDTSDQVVLDNSKDKGKAIMDSEPPPYVLKMQEDIDSQKVKHEALEVKFDNLAETQKVMATKQDTMDSKLDAIFALLSKKP
ncbi:hypothetical protein A2U01_0003546 [Trifolium medium]|uniref:Uncharacterized protein n=1 Tax=Trifolium medium TaxID=97028 RepID=A0A392M6M4_9FABA|nr:hypothetical protein [Trifolium medium]